MKKIEIPKQKPIRIEGVLEWIQFVALIFFVMFFSAPFLGPLSPLAAEVLAIYCYCSGKAEE